MKCPVCKSKMLVETDYIESTLCERLEICTNCKKYYHEFRYGVSLTKIGNTEIYSHYKDSKTRTKRGLFIERNRIAKERKRWSKQSRKGGK